MNTLTTPVCFELSVIQKEIWSSNNAGDLYNQFTIDFNGPLYLARLKSAVKNVLQRNEVLRSRLFVSSDSIFPSQFSVDEAEVDLHANLNAPYDPEHDEPVRFIFSAENNSLTVRLYALWGDSYSCRLLCEELRNEYFSVQTPACDDVIEYKNFAKWQNDLVNEPDSEAVAFWKNYDLFLQKGLLPFEKQKAGAFSPAVQRVGKLPAAQYDADVLLSMFCKYLNRFNENEITIGFVPHKRNYDELGTTLGLVSRALPLKFSKDEDVIKLKDEVLSWSDYFSLERSGEYKFFPYVFEYVEAGENITDIYSVTDVFSLKLFCAEVGGEVVLDLYYDENKFNKQDIAVISAQLLNNTSKELELINASNNTKQAFDLEKSVIEMFFEQVQLHPTAVALIDEGQELTYKELGERVDQLAAYLQQQHGIQKGDTIAILLERSQWLVIAILAVLRAGAAYVPIDTSLPKERVDYIVEDCKAKAVITESEAQQTATVTGFPAISSTDLAYIIYTSGSTGKPKGCMLTHGNLSNYIQSANHLYLKGTEYGNAALITSVSFDLTVTCLFLPLIKGKKLFIGDRRSELNDLLKQVFENPAIDTIKLTPAHLLLLKSLDITATNVRVLIVGGEQLTWEQVNPVWAINNEIKIYNEYGPTETTVGSIVKEIKPTDQKILIGKPLCNTQVFILNDAKEMASIGERGEIYINGAGVSKGYLSREDLTKEKFVDGMYRTGDIGRWLPDGNIEYLGRNDDQVKLRGYRIELGEIEAALQGLLESVLVIVRNEELIAYFTSKQKEDAGLLRSFLSARLPVYMVPAHFVQLEQFPLTANGKIDKAALPDVSAVSVATYVAPRNAIERCLVEVYEDVLKKHPIGIKEDFFALGGDSIKSIQLVARLKQKGYTLTIKDVLTNPVIEELAAKVKLTIRTAEQGVVTGSIPLTPIQAAFFENPSHHFNQSVLLVSKEPLSVEKLRRVFDKLVEHHDALRMVYPNGQQYNKGLEQGYSFEITDDFESVQSSINLETGPLFKVALSGNKLLLVAHHLIIDGVSWRILLEDIATLYQQGTLPLKSDSFKYWAEKLPSYNEDAAYWDAIENTTVEKLPLDHPQGRNLIEDINTLHFSLDNNLLNNCYQALKTDTNDILLTALTQSLGEVFKINKALISLEGHGREQIDADIDVSRTVGWFTSMYPAVLEPNIISVKETLHRVPSKGIGYGILRYLQNKPYTLRPEITFNYMGEFTEESGSLFTFSNEPRGSEASGNRQRDAILDVSGMVVNEQLNISINYSNKQFEASTIQRLTNAFEKHLHALIHQLSNAKATLTPVDLTYTGLTIEELQEFQQQVEDIYTLSPLQEGMYYEWLASPNSSLYFDQITCRVKGKLSIEKLKNSYHQLVARHAVLRTYFTHHYGGHSLQVVIKDATPAFEYIETQDIQAYKQADIARGFQLDSGSQVRLAVLRTAEDTYEFIWSHHHILMDGWCLGLLIKEFFQIYQGQTPDKAYPYSDYIKWLNARDPEQSLNYWRNYLSGYDTISSLPKLPSTSTGEQYETEFALSTEVNQSIKTLCAKLGITESSFFHVAWAALLSRYNNTNDVVYGLVVSGRPADLQGVENMIGLFINTVPVRIKTDEQKSFDILLKEFQQSSVTSADHHYTQLARIQSLSELGQGLFDHILQVQNYPIETIVAQSGISLSDASISGRNNFGFTAVIIPGDTFKIRFLYDSALYQQQQVHFMQAHFANIIRLIAQDPSTTVNALEYTTSKEQHYLLHELNNTTTNFPAHKTVVQLFEEQVNLTPGNTAIAIGNRKLTYRELNERSNQLAYYLQENYPVKPDALIAIQLERSEQAIIAMLGILKAGAAYLPIDLEYPADRVQYMLGDSKAILVLDDLEMEDFSTRRSKYPKHNPSAVNKPSDLAYVMYTSGSTGNPKGVMIEHTGIVRLVKQTNYIDVHENDAILSLSNFVFDGSTFDIYGALLNGATLVISSSDLQLNMDAALTQNNVTIFFVTTALFNAYADTDRVNFSNIRAILFGGEMVSVKHVKKFQEKFPATKLLHMYGPTENTTYSTFHDVGEIDGTEKTIPIGVPISNTTLYILDASGQPAPVGLPGEICLGGPGLARGYLNRPELTNEKFVTWQGNRIYRTGDLGKWRQEGAVEIMGRKDEQVKVRGFRIELGEIENKLNACPGIESAAVIAKATGSGDKELVAFVVSKQALNAPDLISFLSASMPAYMVPSQFVQLDEMPLSITRKIDKRKLAGMQLDALSTQEECIAPRNETEETMAAIWRKVLDRQTIGINYDFFESGGDSIKVIRLISELRKQLGWQLSIADIYKNSTIEGLVAFYEANNQVKQDVARDKKEKQEQVLERIAELKDSLITHIPDAEDIFPMSDISKGMVHESLIKEGEGIYHDQIVFQKTFKSFNVEQLQAVIDLMVQTQPILRSQFNLNDHGTPVHIIRKNLKVPVHYKDLSGSIDQSAAIRKYLKQELQHPFDLTTAPLWRIAAFNLGNDEYAFVWQIHHAIIDGFSCAIFIESVFALYDKLEAPKPLGISYRDYIVQQEVDKLNGAVAEFWKKELADVHPVNLFEDDVNASVHNAFMGADYFRKVKYAADWLGASVKSLSFSAYLYTLGVLSGNNTLVAGLVTHTRPDHEHSDKLIGCFLNTIPFKINLEPGETCSAFVKRVHNKMVQLKEYEKLSTLEIARLHSDKLSDGNPFFDVIFNYVNFHEFSALNGVAAPSALDVQSNFRTNTFFDFTVSTTGDQYNLNLDQVKPLRSGFPAARIIELYTSILDHIINNPAAGIGELEFVTETEKQQLLVDFNNTKADYPSNKTVHELFEAQVKETPDNIAVVCGDVTLTYAQLNEQANAVAHFIRSKHDVRPGEFVAIQMPRSEQAVIVMLAILKLGAAYIPIDMEYPAERVNFILDDSKCKLVIREMNSSIGDAEHVGSPHDLAYVIYTSGSTGIPKGVMVEHTSIVRLVKNTNYISLTANDSILSLSNFVFDGSTFDIYGALLNGGKLVIPTKDELIDPVAVNELINANNVTAFFITTALFNTFVDSGSVDFKTVRQIFFGGELVSVSHVRRFMQQYPWVSLVHVYGPTENTTFSSFYPITHVDEAQHTIPIGGPIANSECYVLNSFNRLVSVGVVGEICVSGTGLARGYLNRENLTREKFVSHPYKPGELMYKTGDAGKWLPDGSIEFVGRNDDQVKIRGHRIETGEIEKVLLKHEHLREVIVLPIGEGSGKFLCAYYTSTAPLELREYLQTHLPLYMVPAYFMHVSKMPLTQNGKIDKKALPIPALQRSGNYIAPRNEVEQKLAAIWSDVLHLEKDSISIDSNFFESGGHSLKVNDLISKIHKEMGAKLPVAEVFRKPTVEELAEMIENVLWVKKENSESKQINEIEI